MSDCGPGSKQSAGWLPEQDALESWLEALSERAAASSERVIHPVIEEFRGLIDSDPVVRMYLNQMIEQVPSSRPYQARHLRSVEHMLLMINELLTTAPEFDESSMVGTRSMPCLIGRWARRLALARSATRGSTRC